MTGIERLHTFFSNQDYMPHGHCYLWRPELVWTHAISDTLIGFAYVAISLTLWILLRRTKLPFSFVVLCFGVFIGACGATHFMEVITLWKPIYGWSAIIKLVTAVASAGTGVYLYRLRHPIVLLAESAKLAEERRLSLEAIKLDLENRVSLRTRELGLAHQRIEFLSEVSRILSLSLDSSETAKKLAQLSVPYLADWCIVDILDSQTGFDRVAVSHFDPTKAALVAQFTGLRPDASASQGASLALRQGKMVVSLKIRDEGAALGTQDPEQLKLIREMGVHSYISIPLEARGRTLGAITFVLARPERFYSDADIETAQEVVRRASIALDNAKLYQEAQESIRARDEFMAIASHELKTPLTQIKLETHIVQRMQERHGRGETFFARVESFIKQVDRSTSRLSRLVEDMIDVGNLRSGRLKLHYERFDLSELIQEIIRRFESEAHEAGCSLIYTECGSVAGEWDKSRIDQVLSNLISNAIHYGRGKPIHLRLEHEDGAVRITVTDQGMGIAPENQEKIFHRFERLVNANEISGLGVGLYIVRELVHEHHGTISVQSELGKGASFKIELPLLSNSAS